jgi:glycine C-acetyltransferase
MEKARIRTQVSAAHSKEDLDFAIKVFSETREGMGL